MTQNMKKLIRQNMKQTENWETRFDKEFGDENNHDIKHFIRTEIESAHKEGYEEAALD